MLDLLVTVTLWGLSFSLAKMALNSFHPLELVTLRLGLAALTAAIIDGLDVGRARRRLGRLPLPGRRLWRPALVLGVFEFAGTYIFYTWSLRYLPSGVVGALTLLTPVFTFLAGTAVGVQRLSLRASLAIFLSVVGGWLCVPLSGALPADFSASLFSAGIFSGRFLPAGVSHDAIIGVSLILLSNLLFAVGNVAISKFEREGFWREHITADGLFCGAILSGFVAVVSGSISTGHSMTWSSWLLPLYLGVVATGVGFYLWNRGVRKVSAVPASLVGNLKAPMSVIWGALLLGEGVTWRLALGLVILIGAVQIFPRSGGPERLLDQTGPSDGRP